MPLEKPLFGGPCRPNNFTLYPNKNQKLFLDVNALTEGVGLRGRDKRWIGIGINLKDRYIRKQPYLRKNTSTLSVISKVKQPDRQCYLEGIVAHCVDHIFEKYLGGESVSMVDDGLSVGTIPAVHFHTSAAATQSPEQQRQIQYFINLLIILI